MTPVLNAYYTQVLTIMGINTIMALGLNLITGVTGQLSLGHAAFMSIGAYGAAILTLNYGAPFWLALLFGALLAAFFGVLLGFPTLRLSGDYLAIATLGFGEITRVILLNLDIAGRALGLSGIPHSASFSGVWILAILSIIAMVFIGNSRLGRAFLAIREDEIAAEAMGVNSTSYKIQAFAIGSFFAGLGGGLYAHYITYLNPSDFGFMKSIEILNMVVLGGMGSIPGTILGAGVLTAIPELLRAVREYRMLFYGGLLIFMMIFKPNGLLGGVHFSTIRDWFVRLFKGTGGVGKAPGGPDTGEEAQSRVQEG
ncbi:MAG: branched-chain amino acid ABC transporter permease [Syntrophothermus sp.]